MTAKAITIFPPGLLKQIRNGQFPMGNSGNTMTNAEVRQSLGVSGHTLKMKLTEGIAGLVSHVLDTYPTTDTAFRTRLHEIAGEHFPSWDAVSRRYIELALGESP